MRHPLRTVILAALLLEASFNLAAAQGSPVRPHWCTPSARKADSTYIVSQATKVIMDSAGTLAAPFRVDDYHVIKTASLEQGVIVSLVPTNPHTRGGGGLVWVDAETFCPIVLRFYE